MTQYRAYWVENVKLVCVYFALLLLLHKSDLRLSLGGKEALYEEKTLSLSSSFRILLNIASIFYRTMLNKYDFRENQLIEIYII
jgi:hypothetical protein